MLCFGAVANIKGEYGINDFGRHPNGMPHVLGGFLAWLDR